MKEKHETLNTINEKINSYKQKNIPAEAIAIIISTEKFKELDEEQCLYRTEINNPAHKLFGAELIMDYHDYTEEPIVIPKRLAPLVSETVYKRRYGR